MRMHSRRETAVIGAVLLFLVSGCSGAASPAASTPAGSPAGPSPEPASPSPTPSPTLDAQALAESAVAMLRDPDVALQMAVDNDVTIGGRHFQQQETVEIVGQDMHATLEIPELDVAVAQTSVDGTNFIQSGEAHAIRDDQLDVPVPSLAEAFPAVVRIGAAEPAGSDGAVRIEITSADLVAFLAATGNMDPTGTVSDGALRLVVDAAGEPKAIEVQASYRANPSAEEETLDATFTVDWIGTSGEPGAPTVAAPDDYWLRAVSELGFVMAHPPEWTRERRDTGGTVGESFSDATGTGLIVQLRPAGPSETLDTLVKTSREEMGYEVDSVGDFTLGGAPAKTLAFKIVDGDLVIQAVRIIAIIDGSVVFITWATPLVMAPTTLPLLTEMIGSFQY